MAGIQNSQRVTDAVKRYLVEHDIPVYRVHSLALGNAQAMANNAGGEDNKPLKTSSVHVRLMENSLAARDAASPLGAAGVTVASSWAVAVTSAPAPHRARTLARLRGRMFALVTSPP